MTNSLENRLRKYVNPEAPFGPQDAVIIEEPDCAAALFDWNNKAFAEMVDGSDVLVGRRGSGKSSLLISVPARKYLASELRSEEAREFKERFQISSKALTSTPNLVVNINTADEITRIEEDWNRRGVVPLVEVVGDQWRQRIWLTVARRLSEESIASLPDNIKKFALNHDIEAFISTGTYIAELSNAKSFQQLLEDFLVDNKIRVVVTIDNIELTKSSETFVAVLSGLIAAVGHFIARRRGAMDVKLCLPAESFSEIEQVAIRPDKDLYRVQYLHWNAAELLHLAAKRLRTYFSIWDPEEYKQTVDLKLSDRTSLIGFWHRYLPPEITNSFGVPESTITYILRHTQLLPRQFILIMNCICRRFRSDGDPIFSRRFSPAEIVKGVEDSERPSLKAVVKMYDPPGLFLDRMLKQVLPRLPVEFDYGTLQSIWNSSAKRTMETIGKNEFFEFWELLFAVGVLGMRSPTEDSKIYYTARFEYNTKYQLAISDKDRICVHPMFSRIYNVDRQDNRKAVLPRGSDFMLHRERI